MSRATSEPAARADQPDFGPSLPRLLRGWLPRLARWQRLALGLLAVAIVGGLLAALFKAETAFETYTQTSSDAQQRALEPIPFNFDYSRKLRISKPKGTYVQAQQTQRGTLVAGLTVLPIAFRAQQGLASGYLPITAIALERKAAKTFGAFRLQFEGRSRVNDVEGYQFAFNAQLGGARPRQLFGRYVILPEPYDTSDTSKQYPPGQAPSRGILISMLATTLDNVTQAQQVGDAGVLKKPFRSFRFGS